MSDSSPALQILNLSKFYGNLQALKSISLNVEQGDFYALLGPNGAGKSTTIGIIASLINKTSGQVRIFGHDMDTNPSSAKRLLGLVPQEFNFNTFEPCIEIIVNQAGYYGIPRTIARESAHEVLQQLGLWDKRRETPRQLSGGMKRRLMIARALVHRPRLLILDEPTAGVDIEVRQSMWKLLRKLNQAGTTIILTTHYLEEAESLCRNIGIINHGKIVADTSMRTLLNQLDQETFILYLKEPQHDIPRLKNAHAELIDPLTLELTVSKSVCIEQSFVELAQNGFQIMSMRNKSNRLETLFMKLVTENVS